MKTILTNLPVLPCCNSVYSGMSKREILSHLAFLTIISRSYSSCEAAQSRQFQEAATAAVAAADALLSRLDEA